jgi:outer membrane lipoprotein-sorting protein
MACAECRADFAFITHLQHRLIESGRAAAKISLTEAVMRRVEAAPFVNQKETTMTRFFSGWGFRLSAAACVASLVAMLLVLSPGTQARAAQVLAEGAQAVANLSSIHLRCRIRAQANENFVSIAPDQDFSPVDVWKQFGPETRWRIEKPGRVALMDGQSAVLYLKQSNIATKHRPSMDAFDTQWLHRFADLSGTINQELSNAKAKGWKLALTKEHTPDGRMKSIVTILAKNGLPEGDYLKTAFIDTSDTRRVYRFDAKTGMLEGAQFFLARSTGDVLVFEITQIECNQPIEASIFHLDLPENVTWGQEQQLQPGDERYIAMSPEQAARAFLEACGREDWKEAGKLLDGMPLSESTKQIYAQLAVKNIGQAFTSKASPHSFVPYEVQFRGGEVKKWNLAMRRNEKTAMWFVDGGF